MPKDPVRLKCRTCRKKFAASKKPDGGWRIAISKKPPCTKCKAHRGSALCRWEVIKHRRYLWEKVAPFFEGRPAAYLTLVPPQRLVAYHQLASINLENEKRAMRRVLRNVLPKGTVLVSIFDISLVDDVAGDQRRRYWVPHFHVLVAGTTAPELRKACRRLYKATQEVKEPAHIKDAPTPKNALNYSLKHIDDVYGDTIFRRVTGSGKRGHRKRRLKREEREILRRFVIQNPLRTYLYLKEFRLPGKNVGNRENSG